MRLAVVLVLVAACADEASSTFEYSVRVGAVPDGVVDVLVDGTPQPIDEATRTLTIDRTFAGYPAAKSAPPVTLEFRDANGATIDLGTAAPGACEPQCGASCPSLTIEQVFVSFDRLHERFDCYSCTSADGTGFSACY